MQKQNTRARINFQIQNQNHGENRRFRIIDAEQSTSSTLPSCQHQVFDNETVAVQQQIENLSIKELKTIRHDVHGTSAKETTKLKRVQSQPQVDLAEESTFISLKFCELDLEINNIEIKAVLSSFGNSNCSTSDSGFAAYKLARSQNPDYVNSPRFKIRFLRAKKYNAREAARLLLRNLLEKLDLFGSEKLTRDICREDVGDDGLRYLELGGLEVSPKRDANGRRIISTDDSLKQKFPRKSIRKAHFYFINSLAEKVDYIRNWRAERKRKETEKMVSHSEVNCDDSIMNESLATLNFGDMESADEREWEFNNLIGIGEIHGTNSADGSGHGNGSNINGDDIPSIITATHPTETTVLCCDVWPEDVLLGRGIKHPGNEYFRQMVADYYENYEASKKLQQTRITKEIVQKIVCDGGRFLKKPKSGAHTNDSFWIEIDYKEARLKVAHTFRTIRKQKKKMAAMLQQKS